MGYVDAEVWSTVRTVDTMQEGKDFVKSGIADTRAAGRQQPVTFKRDRGNPGNTRIANFLCATHENCPVRVRVVKNGGDVTVQISAGTEHSTQDKQRPRKNSAFTTDQLRDTYRALNAGGRPASIRSSMTNDKLEDAKKTGTAPKKRTAGITQ